jgi:uncharacterized Zn-binding protein involved in type VI secretion
MKGVIRLGDPTSHGGMVTSARSTVIVRGIAVALLGDSVICPIKGHKDCTIQTINKPTVMHNGVPVAMHGDLASCGAVLLSTVPASGVS